MDLPKKGEEVPLSQIKEICKWYGLHGLWAKIEKDPPQKPFMSDGCSMWFDSWKGISLYPACFVHDLKYWAGYPEEDVERLIADAELMIDVARLLNSTGMAETMFHGVRVGTKFLSNHFHGVSGGHHDHSRQVTGQSVRRDQKDSHVRVRVDAQGNVTIWNRRSS